MAEKELKFKDVFSIFNREQLFLMDSL